MTKQSDNERIKSESNYLRGTITDALKDQVTGAFSSDDQQLIKFHGFYQQDDRDLRKERKDQKLEPLYSAMLRVRIPGGIVTPEQWLAANELALTLTESGSLRLTTRQTFQYHGILKRNIKPLIQMLDKVMLDSIAACGDVNRQVLCNPNPVDSVLHKEVYHHAVQISEHLLPSTRAYYQIWLDEPSQPGQTDEEPIYGKTYLPRKFKIAVAIPPHNDVDVHANDLSFVAIAKEDQLLGFNVLVGGGMGSTHGDTGTYPRIASNLGFIDKENVIPFATAVVKAQRDLGNRSERRFARLKYTVDDLGVERFKKEVEERAGLAFSTAKPYEFTQHTDRFGWVKGIDGREHLTLFIPSGRIIDGKFGQLQTGLVKIAKIHQGDFRITASQNLIVAGVPKDQKPLIEAMARAHGLINDALSIHYHNAMACVALPTCTLAMSEAERYLPDFISKFEQLMQKHGLMSQPIVLRITGCPNGCARPFLAEIAMVGKALGRYNLYLGGDGKGTRLNKLFRENITEIKILEDLDALLGDYAQHRQPQEPFGDYVIRAGHIKATREGKDFHD
ncbi:MAG: assimilatory sulfite reductase (NADPH) hemoprotein subunit [Hydrogenovibrio sp.]|uniref:assimilatory sulfite reductase (NADPH) hemoprotein subunit n=1 Tax=Hydrogenovibrio sp. TaxID=2065821 RepID=UPI00286FC359|nr:assimilatory sulfite reductase (NADPH) hemoprotein subunit [Hydrogenovibrio sp.]MDR9499756.1 assimilatory sulfite reductase (NADPH) hemoprotein subunit [Hydrogenovibrio sp.]